MAILGYSNEECSFIQDYYRSLKSAVQDEISRLDRPNDLSELTRMAVEIDNRQHAHEMDHTTNEMHSSSSRATPSTPACSCQATPQTTLSQTMVKREVRMTTSASPSCSIPGLTHEGKVSEEEEQRRKANNLYGYCGGKHDLYSCPTCKARAPGSCRPQAPAQSRATKMTASSKN